MKTQMCINQMTFQGIVCSQERRRRRCSPGCWCWGKKQTGAAPRVFAFWWEALSVCFHLLDSDESWWFMQFISAESRSKWHHVTNVCSNINIFKSDHYLCLLLGLGGGGFVWKNISINDAGYNLNRPTLFKKKIICKKIDLIFIFKDVAANFWVRLKRYNMALQTLHINVTVTKVSHKNVKLN